MSFWDDEAGYDLRDPKHPTWADRMADMADIHRKLEKEQRIMDEGLNALDVETEILRMEREKGK